MKSDTMAFEAFPRVLRPGVATRIRLRPRAGSDPLADGAAWRVMCQPMEGEAAASRHGEAVAQVVRAAGNALELTLTLAGEQEYAVLLQPEGAAVSQAVATVRLYAINPDWFGLRPFKGDFHIHSSRSDGREPPAHVAAACRRKGMDFMAVTDHRQYAPSLEAITAFAGSGTDLRLFPGEEVHSPDTAVHIINFGGRWSINEAFATERYHAEVRARAATLEGLPAGMDPLPYAACEWVFAEVRRAGGLGIFCHPSWVHRHRLDVTAALTDAIFARRPFDAYEVIGGYYLHESESNHLQVLRYHLEQSRGGPLPIVGVSDAHGCERPELFGWYYTVILAPSSRFEDVVSAVRDLRSVAVEHVPGLLPRATGPLRLARYVQFLLREVLPAHDGLCREEGLTMLALLAGDAAAAGRLQSLKGQVERLYASLWAG